MRSRTTAAVLSALHWLKHLLYKDLKTIKYYYINREY